jgi:ABC-type polysaccharide/polyol phosphate transport system ATPase subunit
VKQPTTLTVLEGDGRSLPAIEVNGVSKRYLQLKEQAMLLRSILPFNRPDRQELLALRDISFTIESGETVGILGRNGSGKSTLMRLMAGVSAPSTGMVRIAGRVAPLLSVGVGFHLEMSGRENVYVNGMLLGLTHSEITELFDEIVEFSEIGDFIDTPVKFYSSGMYVRLGFSVAVHIAPQILLLDEVLAVGDVAFQLKCFDRMRELQRRGTTIVMVSHNMHAIRLLCPRVLLLRKGQLEYDGDSETAISRHHQFLALDASEDHFGHTRTPVTVLDRTVRRNGVETAAAEQDDLLEATWTVRFEEPVKSPHAVFRILAEDGTLAYQTHTTFGSEWQEFAAGATAEICVRFRPRFGGGGTFRLTLDVTDSKGVVVLVTDTEGPRLYVAGLLATTGLGDVRAEIDIAGQPLNNWTSVAFDEYSKDDRPTLVTDAREMSEH